VKNAISIFLAMLILISNMGFTFATHYCGGQAVKSELGIGDHHSLDCGMTTMDVKKEKSSDGLQYLAEDCCHNVAFEIVIKDDYQFSVENLTLTPHFTIALFSCFFDFDISELSQQLTEYIDYTPPPLIKQDVQVLFQSFLI
jgi:hypothetical protein